MRKITAKIQAPMPLPQFLRQSFPYLQVKILNNALSRRDIKRGGQRLNEKSIVEPGDTLEVFIADQYLDEAPAIDIVYEDKNILIAVKQPGLSVVGDKNGAPTLTSILQQKYPSLQPCHRLDHFTGGLTVFALNQTALTAMEAAFLERSVEKIYRCLVFGKPNPGTGYLTAYLFKNAEGSRVSIFDKHIPGAKRIETAYQMLDTCDTVSLLKVELITGRTHQIRAHLASIGHPVCGDDKYGDRAKNKEFSVSRQQLWATEIHFRFEDGPLAYLNGKGFSTKAHFTMKGFES